LNRLLVILNPTAGRGRARRVVIESQEPLLVEADGEIAFQDARRLEVDGLPGALAVFA